MRSPSLPDSRGGSQTRGRSLAPDRMSHVQDLNDGALPHRHMPPPAAGHVHAYERMHRVLNGCANPCAPIYLNLGDGGNREGAQSPCTSGLPPHIITSTRCIRRGCMTMPCHHDTRSSSTRSCLEVRMLDMSQRSVVASLPPLLLVLMRPSRQSSLPFSISLATIVALHRILHTMARASTVVVSLPRVVVWCRLASHHE